MTRDRAAVKNAADREQVTRAERAEKRIEERFQASLQAVMATPEGRLVLWSYLGRFGVYRGVYAESPQRMAFEAGRQQCGHDLLADLVRASDELYQVMEREMRAMADLDAQQAEVVQHRDRTNEAMQ